MGWFPFSFPDKPSHGPISPSRLGPRLWPGALDRPVAEGCGPTIPSRANFGSPKPHTDVWTNQLRLRRKNRDQFQEDLGGLRWSPWFSSQARVPPKPTVDCYPVSALHVVCPLPPLRSLMQSGGDVPGCKRTGAPTGVKRIPRK